MGNKISKEELRIYQNKLYECSDSEIIKSVKEFLDREDIFYLNTCDDDGKYHEKLPLKKFGLSKLITDDYYVRRVGECIDGINGKSYGDSSDHLIIRKNSFYIDSNGVVIEKEGTNFCITIGPRFGKNYQFGWGWAHKHAHYDEDYFYDNFILSFFREKKLERILNAG